VEAGGAEVLMALVAGAEPETLGNGVAGGVDVAVRDPVDLAEAPEVVVAGVVAATVEFPLLVIVGILEVIVETTDEVATAVVGTAGAAGSFAALNPNINPNPNPSASARIINTANPQST
jgi:hypothetical protein